MAEANRNGVIFYWAIHPGGDIKWNDTDRRLLLEKESKENAAKNPKGGGPRA